MASFRGAYEHSIDEKGRLALPKPFRRITGVKGKDGFEPVLVVTKGFNDCVSLYTEDEWPRYEERLRAELFTNQSARDFVLELAEVTQDAPIDTVGRILIPDKHRRIGGFGKGDPVLVLGMFDHVELWKPERYREHLSRTEGSFEDRAMGFFRRNT